MDSLLLDRTSWDACVDASRNIAVASGPYALAQNAACAIKLFQAEAWYDTTQGVPYFAQILGKAASVPLMKAKFCAAALTVPGVASAQCFITAIEDRKVSGQVQIADANGNVTAAAF